MPAQLLVVGATLALMLGGSRGTPGPTVEPGPPVPPGLRHGIRTDRLGRNELAAWNRIVEVVLASDPGGRPLHPTLRGLWNAVDGSEHSVHVVVLRGSGHGSYVGGRFQITRVDPAGRSHEGTLTLSLGAIDRACTGVAAVRPNGLVPFAGLDRWERYAEVLGHELAHAAWHLASTERAALAERIDRELEGRAVALRSAPARRVGLNARERAAALDRVSRELEGTADAAEAFVWAELRTGGRRR